MQAKKKTTTVNAFSANARDLAMLDVVARYHGMTKSATITVEERRMPP